MKCNKGFAPLILLAIIVGALVIGGGAYYLGKSSKVENKEVKVEENNLPSNPEINKNQNLPVVNNNQQSSISSITVLSPNGGETYSTSTTIKQIPVTWKSSGIISKNVAIYIKNISTGNEIVNSIVPDNGSTNIYGVSTGNYKIRICSTNQSSKNFEVAYDPDCATASDYSDNSFTVNSVNNKNNTTNGVYTSTTDHFSLSMPTNMTLSEPDPTIATYTSAHYYYVQYKQGVVPSLSYFRNISVSDEVCTGEPVTIDNIQYKRADDIGGGMESSSLQSSYCTIHAGKTYRLFFEWTYARFTGSTPDRNVATVKFNNELDQLQIQFID
ncbi:MAG: hypothetical protein WCI91_01525 [Candidatus Nomurabacteria bacterium]